MQRLNNLKINLESKLPDSGIIFHTSKKKWTPSLYFTSFTYTDLNLGHVNGNIIAVGMINSLICLFSL